LAINEANNNIGAKGCKFLSQGSWRWLERIYLGYNNIEKMGIFHLSKAQWPKLAQL